MMIGGAATHLEGIAARRKIGERAFARVAGFGTAVDEPDKARNMLRVWFSGQFVQTCANLGYRPVRACRTGTVGSSQWD